MGDFNFNEWLDGKKTYISAVAVVCYALGGMVSGYVEPTVAMPLILGALGLGSIRHAISKVLVSLFQVPKSE